MESTPVKKLLLFAVAFVSMACTFTSCELDTCKICKQVTYVNDSWDHEGQPEEYCGARLIAIEAQGAIIDGNIRTTWECK